MRQPLDNRKLLAAGVALVVVVAATLAVPWPRGLTGPVAGDQRVIDVVGPYLDQGFRKKVAVATIAPDGAVAYAGWGADEHTAFEIGSITKTFTAQLLADSVARGELTLDTTLGEVFSQLDGTDAGKVTMEQLATHTSGLPRIIAVNSLRTYLQLDPYTKNLDELLGAVRGLTLAPGEYAYSNTGFALLGAAVAERAGMDYPTLVRTRLLEPMGMRETTVPVEESDLPAGHLTGYNVGGVPAAAWTMRAYAPAGSIRSTTHDLALWIAAVRDGRVPGMDSAGAGAAVDPRAGRVDAGEGRRVGLAWIVDERDGTTVTWHNGGTGGFSSFAGYTSGGAGVVVLSNTAFSVDGGMNYLFDHAGEVEGGQ